MGRKRKKKAGKEERKGIKRSKREKGDTREGTRAPPLPPARHTRCHPWAVTAPGSGSSFASRFSLCFLFVWLFMGCFQGSPARSATPLLRLRFKARPRRPRHLR